MEKHYEPIRLTYTVPINDKHDSLERNTLNKALDAWTQHHESRTAKVKVWQIVRAGGYPVAMPAGLLTIDLA